jgi:hypothetical protein
MRETVQEDWSGCLVESLEALVDRINYLKRDDWFGDGCRERCREWASRFSVQNMTDRVEELCMEAVGTGGW